MRRESKEKEHAKRQSEKVRKYSKTERSTKSNGRKTKIMNE